MRKTVDDVPKHKTTDHSLENLENTPVYYIVFKFIVYE